MTEVIPISKEPAGDSSVHLTNDETMMEEGLGGGVTASYIKSKRSDISKEPKRLITKSKNLSTEHKRASIGDDM